MTLKAKKIYALRKITVEPVIGQVKENFGFRQFLLRGLEGVNTELNIVGTVHNLKKIWRDPDIREKLIGYLTKEGGMRSDCGEEYVKILELKVFAGVGRGLLDSFSCYTMVRTKSESAASTRIFVENP